MTILVFWPVDNDKVDRHTLDNVSDLDAFDILWHERDELRAVFYRMDTQDHSDPFGQYRIWNASDYVRDYNDTLLDGEMWTTFLVLDDEDVKRIIEE